MKKACFNSFPTKHFMNYYMKTVRHSSREMKSKTVRTWKTKCMTLLLLQAEYIVHRNN